MDTFLQDEVKAQKDPKPGTWGSMNSIQKGGVIGAAVLFLPMFIYKGRLGNDFGVASWSVLLFGYVAGSLWKIRHALHFWWSMLAASLIHVPLLPTYDHLVDQIKNSPQGKGYIYLAGGLVCVETITLIYILKHAAMWLHKRTAGDQYSNKLSR